MRHDQITRAGTLILAVLGLSAAAFGQAFHDAGGAPGTYGNPYGWLGNGGANAWEEYRSGAGVGSIIVPNQPVQATNVAGNNARVHYEYVSTECPWQSPTAGPLGAQYLTSTNNPGILLNRTAVYSGGGNPNVKSDPANLFYYKWASDMFWERWTSGQVTLRVGFMEDPTAFVTTGGGDTGNMSVWTSQGSDSAWWDWQFKWNSGNPDDEYVMSVQRAVCMSGVSNKAANDPTVTNHRRATGGWGDVSSTVKKCFSGSDANEWCGATQFGLGVTTVDYVYVPGIDDPSQTDPTWPGVPAPGGPNDVAANDANDLPAIEVSAKMYATSGSVALGGDDKFAPNTGGGDDWSAGDVILQVKTAVTVWSMRVDTTDIGNTNPDNWEGGTFDWQNAVPFIAIEHGGWNRMPMEIVAGIVHPGDTNTDGRIDYSGDISVAVVNYGQQDKALAHGDVNQDGQVDYTGDLSLMCNAYCSWATDLPPPSGELELVIDYVTGEVSIVANSATNVAGFEFKSPDGSIITGSLGTTGQFSMNLATSLAATEFNLSGGSALDGTYSLGLIFAGAQNWTFGYNFVGGTLTQSTDDVTYIPEPATLVLLGAAVPLVLRRQPKSRSLGAEAKAEVPIPARRDRDRSWRWAAWCSFAGDGQSYLTNCRPCR